MMPMLLLRGAMQRPRAALLAVALTLCLLLAPVRGADSPFTQYKAVQKANTRKFLQAFVDANPLLEKLPSVDFCEWVYSECTSKGVNLYLDERAMVRLPEMSSDTVGKYVLVTSINLSYGKGTLKGTLPASWGSLTHVEYISLYSNSLTGTLPPEWAKMKSAKWFLLYRNELTGTIPEAWSSLRYMTWACLNDNNLTGTLPSSWGSAPQLTIIEARGNRLTGTLPPTWGSLRKVSSITLTDNNLTGPLPEEWASAQPLYGVSVERNNLCGCVPNAWVSHTFLYGIRVDDSLLAADCSTANACTS
ncbi:surface_membrane_protein_gp46-like_protein [Leishmania major strain Friedlin]|nr:surface_membrane_protein_gp46-like_protein [Leishmania major strain Friedlin]